jgi:hypothetical protein
MADEKKSMSYSIPLLGDHTQSFVQSAIRPHKVERGILSRLFFCWVVPVLRKANKTILEADHIPDLDYESSSEYLNMRYTNFFESGDKTSPNLLAKSLLKTF